MKLNELATTEIDAVTEADLEWEATLREEAASGRLAAIGAGIIGEFEQGQTEEL